MTVEENPRVGTQGVSQQNPLNTTNSTRDWLYALAIHGFHLLPLIPGEKRPAITDWEKRATVDPARLDRWPKDAGVGIACGRSGLVVIDCDSHGSTPPPEWDRPGIRDGVDVFADLWSRHSPNVSMFDTFTVTTPSGGLHLYFRAPVGSRIRNRTGLEWQVDVRARGGYACGPGTNLKQGTYTPAGDPGKLLPLPPVASRHAGPAGARTAPPHARSPSHALAGGPSCGRVAPHCGHRSRGAAEQHSELGGVAAGPGRAADTGVRHRSAPRSRNRRSSPGRSRQDHPIRSRPKRL
ncbi:bifunctional DNA primase/polymerase [Kocuria rhizophila]|uniref:bifunctional DNA primase/polymerase n=1 Tax=Kocuria rhizophila TaxID=72000 RepID=UPI001E0B13A3|nr:bifunctional DNA primase/polymerase [Kocuria rhizophila]